MPASHTRWGPVLSLGIPDTVRPRAILWPRTPYLHEPSVSRLDLISCVYAIDPLTQGTRDLQLLIIGKLGASTFPSVKRFKPVHTLIVDH